MPNLNTQAQFQPSGTPEAAPEAHQQDIAHKLLRPVAFQHPVEYLKLLETHISWILLTGDYAYKIKKPVKLPFVDYSTASQRQAFCHKEFELNSHMAPDIYLGVVPIMQGTQEPSVDGDGWLIDCAVRMREFPQENIFDSMLKSDQLKSEHIEQLTVLIANSHREATVATQSDTESLIGTLLRFSLDNLEFLRDTFSEGLLRRTVATVGEWVEQTFGSLRDVFASRIENGFIRMCHGDMHLQNILLYKNKVQVFDCIEFSRALQFIDCMNDVAFPVMDLMAHDRLDFARRLLTQYIEQTGDYDGLKVLNFYMVYRALIRAKVSLMKSGDADSLQQAERYIETARQLTDRPQPQLWITCGVSGSGKSTQSMKLVEQTGAIRIRSDVERNRLFGIESTADKYSEASTEKVYRHLLELADKLLSDRLKVVVDATFLQRKHREQFAQLAGKHSIQFGIIRCEAGIETLEDRVSKRTGDASQATVGLIEKQLQTMDPLSSEEERLVSELQG